MWASLMAHHVIYLAWVLRPLRPLRRRRICGSWWMTSKPRIAPTATACARCPGHRTEGLEPGARGGATGTRPEDEPTPIASAVRGGGGGGDSGGGRFD
eukprot:COSAG01_NODE_7711_length_3089_cov_3.476589_2_plen_98_part_00